MPRSRDASDTLAAESIGRYRIERLLARGGMAEVLLAKAEGPQGFSKTIVIKRILPEYADDPGFVEMFLNEARLAALLDHPNIVQVFDFGEHEGRYFLAMEYVHGQSLRNLLRHFQSLQQSFPERLAAQIIIGACEGLHYAHGLCDDAGTCYNIIHRDVTPENLLVSMSGIPKIVDFGIAKAVSNTAKTEAGTLKGKYHYMAPEQIRGEAVDQQVDVYALGITLYELLSGGHRPYRAENELGLLKSILDGKARPLTQLNAEVSPRLAEMVGRAMAPNRRDRLPDAASFAALLQDFVAETGNSLTSAPLAQLVKEVSKKRGAEKVADVGGSGAASPHPRAALTTALTPTGRSHRRGQVHPEAVEVKPATQRFKLRRAAAIASVLAVGALAPVLWTHSLQPNNQAPPLPAAPAERAISPSEPIRSDAAPTPGEESKRTADPRAPNVPQPPAAAESPDEAQPSLAAPMVVKPPISNGSHSPQRNEGDHRPARGEGYLTVRCDPWCEVFLDGEKLGSTPLSRVPVASGKHTLELKNDGERLYRRLRIDVRQGKELRQAIVFTAPP